jgi:hypothetical protein
MTALGGSSHGFEKRFRKCALRAIDVTIASAGNFGFYNQVIARRLAVGDQQIFFMNGTVGELFGKRPIGRRRFAKDDHAAGLFIKTMDDGERGPARFTVTEPIINAFPGMRTRGVRVQAGGFVHHQQMFIFKNDAGNQRPLNELID